MYQAMTPVPLKLTDQQHERLRGLTVCHLVGLDSERHIRQQLERLAAVPVDLLILTGPYVKGGLKAPESQICNAVGFIEEVLNTVSPRYGAFGIFGAQDPRLFRSAVKAFKINWLKNKTITHKALPLNITGVSERVGEHGSGDFLGAHLNGYEKTITQHLGLMLLPASDYLRYTGKVYHQVGYLRGEVSPFLRDGGNIQGGINCKDGWCEIEEDVGALPLFVLE